MLDKLPVEGARDYEDLGGEIQGLQVPGDETCGSGLVQHRLKSLDCLLTLRGQLRVVVHLAMLGFWKERVLMEKDIHPELDV